MFQRWKRKNAATGALMPTTKPPQAIGGLGINTPPIIISPPTMYIAKTTRSMCGTIAENAGGST